MRNIEVRSNHRREPPRLPDAVYDQIADALVAKAERMASSGSSPSSGTSLKVPNPSRQRSKKKIRARQ